MMHGPPETTPERPDPTSAPDLVWRHAPQFCEMPWPPTREDAGRERPDWWPPGAWRTEPR
jgi:hypothetical protein